MSGETLREFTERCKPLLNCEQLFLPVGFLSGGNSAEQAGEALPRLESALRNIEGKICATLYSDSSMLIKGTQFVKADTLELLRESFFLPTLERVLIDYPFSKESTEPRYCVSSPTSLSFNKIDLARVVGGVSQGGFLVLGAVEHAERAERLLWEDKIFESFYHSVAARLQGAAVDDYFFAEIDALFAFGMLPQVEQYLKWYQQSGRHQLYCAEQARYLVTLQQFELANQWLKELRTNKELSFHGLYIQGLANYKQQHFAAAAADLRCCLEKFEHHHEARLSLGLALRSEGLKRSSAEMLKEAGRQLLQVAQAKGYHAAEALAHLGALMVTQQNWDKAENFFRESLRLRENKVVRGLLEQAMVGARS